MVCYSNTKCRTFNQVNLVKVGEKIVALIKGCPIGLLLFSRQLLINLHRKKMVLAVGMG